MNLMGASERERGGIGQASLLLNFITANSIPFPIHLDFMAPVNCAFVHSRSFASFKGDTKPSTRSCTATQFHPVKLKPR